MRYLPIDADRLRLLASGKLMARPVYAELSDGSRKRVPGDQERDENGVPLWTVDCYADDGVDDEDGRAEVVGVIVGSHDRPTLRKFEPVMFEGLEVNVYVPKTGRLTMQWRADRIVSGASVKSAA